MNNLLKRLFLWLYIITDIRPVKTRNENLGLMQLQFIQYIFLGNGIGTRRQCYYRYIREVLLNSRQPQILRPEIMPPLRYTVRLIYGKHCTWQCGEEIHKLHPVAE